MSSKEDYELLKKARFCDIAERYQNMADVMKAAMKNCHEQSLEITIQHRNLFSLAYKNLISSRRSSWRVLYIEKQKLKDCQTYEFIIADSILQIVEKELLDKCNEVLEIIDKYAMPVVDSSRVEHNVFFLKMKGVYFR